MNISHLSDESLLKKTSELVFSERKLTTEILHHLREVNRRKLYCTLGYGSLFDYCVKGLGYSPAAAQRRIEGMRLLTELPELEQKIREGKLTLSVVAQAQTFSRKEKYSLEKKKELIETLEGKSAREVEKELAARPPEAMLSSREKVRAVSETHSEVRFVANEELLRDLEKLKGLLAHKYPHLSMGELVQLLAKMALEKLDPAREPKASQKKLVSTSEVEEKTSAQPNPRSRTIPRSIRREVWKRDQGTCSYQDPKTAKRCGSVYQLELDHIQPFALSGPSTTQNLRLLCRRHNARAAIEAGLSKV